MANNKIKRCVSLYSFHDELMRGDLTLESSLAKLQEFGAEGVEILSDAVFPMFPRISDTQLHEWRGLLEKYNLKPVCHDQFLDIKINQKRQMSIDEMSDSVIRDIIYARKLGAEVVRLIAITPVPVIEKVAPYAEKFGVKLGLEVHSPWNLESDHVQKLLEVIHKVNNGYVGILPDCGIFFKKFPRILAENARSRGIDEKYIEYMKKIYETGDLAGLKNAEAIMKCMTGINKELLGMGATQKELNAFTMIIGYSWNNPTCLLEYMPYIVHIHAKFLDMTDEGYEYSCPYDQVIDVLKKGGYDGYLSSEYEGGLFLQATGNVDSIEQVRRQQAMFKKLIES